jgi:hypothetical protein
MFNFSGVINTVVPRLVDSLALLFQGSWFHWRTAIPWLLVSLAAQNKYVS